MVSYGPISWEIDFDRPGIQHERLSLLHSDDINGYGEIPIPISILKNGSGPTILLTAGNHGNEYEGQIILRNLLASIDLEKLNGRLIVLPAFNAPAVRANQRVSPLDDGNLNRSFPGAPDQGPTKAIAGVITNHLLPMVDWALDFHSGDRSSQFLLSGFLCSCADIAMHERNVEFASVFAAPYTFVVESSVWQVGYDPHAHNRGVPLISTELGGGGGVTAVSVEAGRRGLRRVLNWLEVYPDELQAEQPPETKWLKFWGNNANIPSPTDGLFEPLVSFGDTVSAGQPAARVHIPWRPGIFETVTFPHDGVVSVMRRLATVRAGDYLFSVTPEVNRKTVLNMVR